MSVSPIDWKKLRHPQERHITAVITVLDVVIVVSVFTLLFAGTEWLSHLPSLEKYLSQGKFLLLAILSAPLVANYARSRQLKRAQEESIRVTAAQLPQIHRVLVRHCARLGVPVPELYLSDSIDHSTSFAVGRGRHHCIILCTHEFSLFPEAFDDIIEWGLAREMGNICLGYARYRDELLNFLVAPIPFLRAPLNQVRTFSRDRFGASLAPRAIRALIVGAAGDRLRNEVNLDTYLAQLDETKEHGFWFSALWPLRKTVPLAHRVRELRRANMLNKV